MKKRLFTFGCSLTAYSWPSWATLLSSSSSFDEVYNWGFAGLGNRAISERVIECDIKNKFTENDTVIIQWSTHLRHDFFHQSGLLFDKVPGWKTGGSIFSFENKELYNDKWLQTFFDEEAYLYHTLNNIYSTQVFLNHKNTNWYMTSIGDIRNLCEDFDVVNVYGEKSIFYKIKELFNNKEYPLYVKTPSFKAYNEIIWEKNKDKWLSPILSYLQQEIEKTELFYKFFDETEQKTFFDYHPKTIYHNYWLKNVLKPKTNIEINYDITDKISLRVEELYNKDKGRKKVFEKRLVSENFPSIVWPESIHGFTVF